MRWGVVGSEATALDTCARSLQSATYIFCTGLYSGMHNMSALYTESSQIYNAAAASMPHCIPGSGSSTGMQDNNWSTVLCHSSVRSEAGAVEGHTYL